MLLERGRHEPAEEGQAVDDDLAVVREVLVALGLEIFALLSGFLNRLEHHFEAGSRLLGGLHSADDALLEVEGVDEDVGQGDQLVGALRLGSIEHLVSVSQHRGLVGVLDTAGGFSAGTSSRGVSAGGLEAADQRFEAVEKLFHFAFHSVANLAQRYI